MTYVSLTNTPMVASITIPKESTKAGSADAAVSRDQRNRQSLLRRGCASAPQKESPTMKAVSCSSSLPTNYPRHNQASPSLFNYQNLNVYVVGNVGHPKAQIVRVVHISDTRGVGDHYARGLPNGHILIHSGDFLDGPPLRHRTLLRRSYFRKSRTEGRFSSSASASSISSPSTEDCMWKSKLRSINEFFRHQPHPYKIFVSGCWDYLGPERPSAAQIQKHLPSAIYLEDAACEILGLKVYGIPWTSADDLRPEDGKSHFTSSAVTSKVKAILPQWLLRSSMFWSQSHRQTGRQRCLSSCTGTSGTPATAAPVKAREMVVIGGQSNVWPAYHSPDTSNDSCSSSANAETGVCESGSPSGSSSCSSSSSSLSSSVSASPLCDGFILPDIKAVEERFARVPSDTNIIVSHMPAWRPELYTHVVDRIQPYLHLCGHDFAGYGVTWRRGVVFSNAAVQLTSNYPRVLPHHPFPRRRKAYSSTFTNSGVGGVSSGDGGSGNGGGAERESTAGGDLFAGTSAPSKVTEHGDPLGVTGEITTLPPRIPRFTDFGVRPRRWRRRLSSLLSRLSLLSTHSLTDSAQPTPTVLDPYYSVGCKSSRIRPTPSSLAALRSGDGDFVVDPTLSVFGSCGSRGGSRSEYVGRRNPLVFDVYVVIEEGVNDREVLPDYSKSAISHQETSGRQSSQSLRRNNACCMHRNHSPLLASVPSHPILLSQPPCLQSVLILRKIDFEHVYLFTNSFTSLHLFVHSSNHSVIHLHKHSSLK
ncbi:metallophosphoesterase domain containing protein [Echinococcus multilocularis]|uniref:Metallophosphoesterase domain containing protein n=1 Tax=Echinococcus multilocularis TaxID=6211 RepID=A0A068YE77_ECHMU|nr:metallophosphoesterase domain containing protein [Echinococcus multilocularis]